MGDQGKYPGEEQVPAGSTASSRHPPVGTSLLGQGWGWRPPHTAWSRHGEKGKLRHWGVRQSPAPGRGRGWRAAHDAQCPGRDRSRVLPRTNHAEDAEDGGGEDDQEVDEGQQDHGNGDMADPAEVLPLEQHLLDGPAHLGTGTGCHTAPLEPGPIPSPEPAGLTVPVIPSQPCPHGPASPRHPFPCPSPVPDAPLVPVTPSSAPALSPRPRWSPSPLLQPCP